MIKASIIIPTHNRKESLSKALQSVFTQSESNYEVIVVDDCSTDGTKKLIEKLMETDQRLKYYRLEKNSGANVARNLGIKKAKGKFIAFLDSDDKWKDNKLEFCLKVLEKDTNPKVLFSNYEIINKNNIEINNKNQGQGYIFFEQLLKDRVAPTSTVIMHRECLKKEIFDEKLPARQDYDLWIRLSKHYDFVYLTEVLVSIYRENEDRISSSYERQIMGTEIILEKIKQNYKEELSKKFLNKVVLSQKEHIIKVYYFNNKSKKARSYLLKSLKKHPLHLKFFFYFFVTLLPSKFFTRK